MLKSEGVSLSNIDPETDLPAAVFVGGWHLTSPDPAFGGLSGLVVEPDGNLLALSDEGAFVWIELVDDVPVEAARIAQMRNAAGDVITDKQWRDAEGLDLSDGIAFVSFEREHRLLAFNLAGCGAAARGAEVARFGSRIAGMSDAMPANRGAEGVALTTEGELLLAIESPDAGLPIAQLDALGGARLVGRIARRGAPVLTGIDRIGDTLYAVLRSYTPLVGNTIDVVSFPLPGGEQILPARRILRLQPKHGTDNFEGIALQRRDEGNLRLWLVSDDNFSSRQRTLLYAFDLRAPVPDNEP
ncbi:MAG: esterase-like activity of phytase family protein [Chromatocurvus sp.]